MNLSYSASLQSHNGCIPRMDDRMLSEMQMNVYDTNLSLSQISMIRHGEISRQTLDTYPFQVAFGKKLEKILAYKIPSFEEYRLNTALMLRWMSLGSFYVDKTTLNSLMGGKGLSGGSEQLKRMVKSNQCVVFNEGKYEWYNKYNNTIETDRNDDNHRNYNEKWRHDLLVFNFNRLRSYASNEMEEGTKIVEMINETVGNLIGISRSESESDDAEIESETDPKRENNYYDFINKYNENIYDLRTDDFSKMLILKSTELLLENQSQILKVIWLYYIKPNTKNTRFTNEDYGVGVPSGPVKHSIDNFKTILNKTVHEAIKRVISSSDLDPLSRSAPSSHPSPPAYSNLFGDSSVPSITNIEAAFNEIKRAQRNNEIDIQQILNNLSDVIGRYYTSEHYTAVVNDLKDSNARLEEMKRELEVKEQDLENLRNQYKNLRSEKNVSREEYEKIGKNIKILQTEYERQISKHEKLKNQHDEINKRKEELEEIVHKQDTFTKLLQFDLEQLQIQLKASHENNQALNNELEQKHKLMELLQENHLLKRCSSVTILGAK
ncbi:hypothetical protein P9112_001279 [Eukaryota sp. TZLM1-RC]